MGKAFSQTWKPPQFRAAPRPNHGLTVLPRSLPAQAFPFGTPALSLRSRDATDANHRHFSASDLPGSAHPTAQPSLPSKTLHFPTQLIAITILTCLSSKSGLLL